jgi:hypothetical protein
MNARRPGTANRSAAEMVGHFDPSSADNHQTGRKVPKSSPHFQVLSIRSSPPQPRIHQLPPRKPSALPSPRDPLFESLRQELGL